MKTNNNRRSVELFAGAAGLGLGLAKAGFSHEIVVENNKAACDTIRLNKAKEHHLVKDWQIREASIQDCDLSDIKESPDLLSGGPPCVSFSIGGNNAGAKDNRNLWPWTIKAAAKLKPRIMLWENVPNLASGHKDYFNYLLKALALPTIANPEKWQDGDNERLSKILKSGQTFDPSYTISTTTLLAADYGTAQKRKRLFIVGVRNDIKEEFQAPDASHSHDELMISKWITGEYWKKHGFEMPTIDNAGLKWIRKHNRKTIDLFAPKLAPHRTIRDAVTSIDKDSANMKPAPRKAKAYKGHTGSPIDEPSKTLRAGDHGVSGGENMSAEMINGKMVYKHFSVREAAAVSGFPDDYEFAGSWSDGLKQIGNAVPLELAQAIGGQLQKILQKAS